MSLVLETQTQAQSADEIYSGAKTLSDELESASKRQDPEAVCSLALTIHAEYLASRRFMMESAERAFEGFEDEISEEEANTLSKQLGGFIAVTDILAKLSGRASMACEMLSEPPG